MSAVIEPCVTRLAPGIPPWPVKRFTVAEYEELVNSGVFDEDDNLELLEGWLVPKMTKNPLHDSRIDWLDEMLEGLLPKGWYCRIQNVLATDDSRPEPDVAVVRGRSLDYESRHPTANDCALVIEVADSTVYEDRRKAAIYARAGVTEYWLVNLQDWQLERMTEPAPSGQYLRTEIIRANDSVPVIIAGTEIARLPLEELLTPRS